MNPSRKTIGLYGELAFTLIEILAVVVILGILALVIVINVTSSLKETQQAVLRDELRFMRTQISLYRATHANPPGVSPTDGSRSEATLVSQMTSYTDSDGNASVSRVGRFTLGIYLAQMPNNPMNGKSDVKLFAPTEPVVADNTTGWLYKPDTLEFYVNSVDYGPSGLNW